MRINFFRERLLLEFTGFSLDNSNIRFASFNTAQSVVNPPAAETNTETTPKKFGTKELVENLGISEEQAKLLISGAKGDANTTITEQELFEEIKKGKVFNTGVRDGFTGDVFDAANYNNKALLDRVDKLDGQTNIKLNAEAKDIAWGAVGAETINPTAIEPSITQINPESNTNNETRLALEAKLKKEGITVSDIKLEGEINKGDKLSGDLYSFEYMGRTRYLLVDHDATEESFVGANSLSGFSSYTGQVPDSITDDITIKGTDGQNIFINRHNYGIPNS